MSKTKTLIWIGASLVVAVIMIWGACVISWTRMNSSDKRTIESTYRNVRLPSYLLTQKESFYGSTFSEWFNEEPFPEWDVDYKITQNNITVKQARSDLAKAFLADGYKVNPVNYLNPIIAWNSRISISLSFDRNKTTPSQTVNNLYVGVTRSP